MKFYWPTIFEDGSEIFFEACFIPLFITLLYFFLFIDMEEHVILQQMQVSIKRLLQEMRMMFILMPEEEKQSYIEELNNEKPPPVDEEAKQFIKENNDKYFKKGIRDTVIYCVIMLILSVISWKLSRVFMNKRSFDFPEYFKDVVYPTFIVVYVIIVIEALFIIFIMGNFIPIDINKTMKHVLEKMISRANYLGERQTN